MSENTTTEFTFTVDVASALNTYNSLNRKNGVRPVAVIAFLSATTDDERQDAVDEHGAGIVRRGLREAAVYFAAHDDADNAEVFWALRDDIDIDGFVAPLDADVAVAA